MTLDDVTKNVKIQRVSCIISSGCPDIRSFFSVDFSITLHCAKQ